MAGSFLAFSLTSSLVLTALYLPYKWLMAGEKTFSFNRMAIIGCYIISLAAFFVVPLFHFDNAPDIAAQISFGDVVMTGVNDSSEWIATSSIIPILLCVYLAGVVCATGFVVWNIVCLQLILSRTLVSEINGSRVNISPNPRLMPFSFGRKIVIPSTAVDSNVGLIVAHENEHIARHHWLDLMLAQAVCIIQWYSPASWLMMSELRAVHEFQADEGAIRQGVNIKEYQVLLIKKAVGVRFPSLTNSLNHSNLKTRITMMYSKQPKGLRRLRPLALVPALGAALLVVNLPAVASALSEVSDSALPSLSSAKVTENSKPEQIYVVSHSKAPQANGADVVAYTATAKSTRDSNAKSHGPNVSMSLDTSDKDVDVPAQYPGGESEMLKKLLTVTKYPAEAMKANEQGRVLVKFIVDKNGKVVSPEVEEGVTPALNQAAIDAVMQLDDFIPAQKDGKPVSVSFQLPVNFSLQGATPAEKTSSDVTAVEVYRLDTEKKDDKVEINLNYEPGKKFDSKEVTKIFINGNEAKVGLEQSDIDYSSNYNVYRSKDGKAVVIIKQTTDNNQKDSKK